MRLKLTFGLYALEPERKLASLLDAFCEWLSKELDADILCDETPDYETLAERIESGTIEIAWLPPIVFLRIGEQTITPVVAIHRGTGTGGFETALVVREDSTVTSIAGLRGTKAAWVDAWSASGYVIPRLRLRLAGIDLDTFFGEEHFYGTHSAAVRAVVDGEADVAATYAHTDSNGNVTDGPWKQIEGARVRTLMTFGEIPADVFAVTRSVPEEVRTKLAAALIAAGTDPERRAMLHKLFGADAFGPVALASYEGLRSAVNIAEWDDMSKVQ